MLKHLIPLLLLLGAWGGRGRSCEEGGSERWRRGSRRAGERPAANTGLTSLGALLFCRSIECRETEARQTEEKESRALSVRKSLAAWGRLPQSSSKARGIRKIGR